MDENQVIGDVEEGISGEIEEEKLLPQSQVNAIVQHAKEKAALKARREAEEEYQRKIEALNSSIQNQGNRNENVSREIDADTIYQQVQERFNQEMQQKQLEEHLSNSANQYLSKMNQGKEIYDDFDEVTKEFDPTSFPKLVYLISGIDNAADVIYELSKNSSKLVTLDILADKNPRKAHAELLNLSRSIAENNSARNEANSQSTPAPLDRLQPSRVSGSNGKMNTTDLRSQPWLKG
jgi:hypothetical protein